MFTYHLEADLKLEAGAKLEQFTNLDFHNTKIVEMITAVDGLSRKIRYWSSVGVYKFKIRWSLSHMTIFPSSKRHSKMAADLGVAARVLHHDDGTFTIRWLFADSIQ